MLQANPQQARRIILAKYLNDGAHWNDNGDYSNDMVHAVRTPSSKFKFQQRKRAKAVKRIEISEAGNEVLSPADATTFRALLSARANYLSQDRPDIGFAAKEFCATFYHRII